MIFYQSNLSPYSSLDSKAIDRLSKSSIDLKSSNLSLMKFLKSLFYSNILFNIFQQSTETTKNRLAIYHHATPVTQNL